MATSGTVGQTTLNVASVVEAAVRRCGVLPSQLTTEAIDTVRNTLYMLLSDWSNRGLNLWRLQRPLVGLRQGQASYTLDVGTIDVINANFRTPYRISSTATSSAGGTAANAVDGDASTVTTQTSASGNISLDFGDDYTVVMAGILPGTAATWNLVFEASTDGVTWSTSLAVGSASYEDEKWAWFEIDPSPTVRYFRVREAGTGTLVVREFYAANQYYDVPMWRMNMDDYSALPNKSFQSNQVYQYWLNRQTTPKMVLWPVPGSDFYLMALQVHRHIEDVGAMTNELDVPQRWYDAVCWMLAYKILPELPGADLQRFDMLKQMAIEPRFDAEAEERDPSPVMLTPQIGGYTR